MRTYKTEMLVDQLIFAEGLRWHQKALWFSDMWDHKVIRLDSSNKCDTMAQVPNRPSGLGFFKDGTPIVVSMTDRCIYTIKDGSLLSFADLSQIVKGDANDMLVTPDDCIYVGNFGYDLFGGAEFATTNLILVDGDKNIRAVAEDLTFPNGMALIDNGATLVVAETWANRLTAFTRLSDGSLTNRRVFAELGQRTPDGICADREDGIWISSFETGEFVRILEGGQVTDVVNVPGKKAVACALGGTDGKQLYCSTYAGAIEDMHTGKRLGAIEVASVSVAG